MATITSHTLNGTDGTHAGGIPVTLTDTKTGTVVFTAEMDEGGRLSQHVPANLIDASATYELLFDTQSYWAVRNMPATVTEIALRFTMSDPEGKYHMPVILNPNSYSMWSSA